MPIAMMINVLENFTFTKLNGMDANMFSIKIVKLNEH